MINIFKRFSFFSLFIFYTMFVQSQSTVNSLIEGSIEQQFDYVIKKSKKWEDYKVVRQDRLNQLFKNVLDTLTNNKSTIATQNNKITDRGEEIAQLRQQLSVMNKEVKQLKKSKSSIYFFGASVKKEFYQVLMWGIVIALLSLLILFTLRFKSNTQLAKQAKIRLQNLEEEYENHRRISLEREQKIRRQLQDELNKNKHS